jgi:hypothetical protein
VRLATSTSSHGSTRYELELPLDSRLSLRSVYLIQLTFEHIPAALEEHLERVAWQPLLGWLEWPVQRCRS